MAVGIGAIIKITDRYIFLGQRMENIYYYHAGAAILVTQLYDVGHDWFVNMGTYVKQLQSNSVQHLEVVVEDIGGDRDYASYPVPIADAFGVNGSGDDCAPFVVAALKLIPGNRSVRPGSKRYSGLRESQVAAGGYLTPAALGDLDNIGLAATQTIDVGGVPTLGPVIVGFPHPAHGNTPARSAITAVDIAGWNSKTAISTQNSRKYGHGT